MHNYNPPPRERLDVKSLEMAGAAPTVDDLSWWLTQDEMYGAPTRARVAVLLGWCARRSGCVVAS